MVHQSLQAAAERTAVRCSSSSRRMTCSVFDMVCCTSICSAMLPGLQELSAMNEALRKPDTRLQLACFVIARRPLNMCDNVGILGGFASQERSIAFRAFLARAGAYGQLLQADQSGLRPVDTIVASGHHRSILIAIQVHGLHVTHCKPVTTCC